MPDINKLRRCRPLLGTYVELEITANASDKALLNTSQTVFMEIERIHHMMSFHDQNSELCHINAHAHKATCTVSPEMREVLELSLDLGQKTNGLFDISIAPQLIQKGLLPDAGHKNDTTAKWQDICLQKNQIQFRKKMQLDLGGIAKGYAVDRALSKTDPEFNITINAGGDLRMSHWQERTVNIRQPESHTNEFYQIKMPSPAVATSASYYNDEKDTIVVPPNQRKSQTQLPYASVSVFAPNCMLADALTKVVFLNTSNLQTLLEEKSAYAFCIDFNGDALWIGAKNHEINYQQNP